MIAKFFQFQSKYKYKVAQKMCPRVCFKYDHITATGHLFVDLSSVHWFILFSVRDGKINLVKADRTGANLFSKMAAKKTSAR